MTKQILIATVLSFVILATPVEGFFHAGLLPQNPIGVDLTFSDRGLPLNTYYWGWWAGSQAEGISPTIIEQFYNPLAFRLHWKVLGGWDGSISLNSRTENELSNGDIYGTPMLMRTPISGYRFDQQWRDNLIREFPHLETQDQNGVVSGWYVRVDHPDYEKRILEDLRKLVALYGHHPSFVGWIQNDLYSDAASVDGGGCSACGVGSGAWYMLSPVSIENWLSSDHYSFKNGDNSVFSGGQLTASVNAAWNQIIPAHESEWRDWVKLQNEVAWDNAISQINRETGKDWLFAIHEVQIDRSWKISNARNAFNGQQPDAQRITNDMRAVGDRFLEGAHFPRTSLYFAGQSLFANRAGIYQYTVDDLKTQAGFLFPFSGAGPAQWLAGPSGVYGLTNPNSIQYQTLKEYGRVLNRMQNVGSYYGINDPTAPKVLFIPSNDKVPFHPQFLTPSLNITVAAITGGAVSTKEFNRDDPNLTKYGNFNQFDVIVLARVSGGNPEKSLSESAKSRIQSFVNRGGGLVYVDSDLGNLALKTGMSVISYTHDIFQPYGQGVVPGGYQKDIRIKTVGGGRVIDIPTPYSNSLSGLGSGSASSTFYAGSPRDSYLILLNNAIFYAARQENRIPTWWHQNFRTGSMTQPWQEETFYSIMGNPGDPLLVWFFTNSKVNDRVQFHIRANAFGISTQGWIAINAQNMEVVARGSGQDILLQIDVPAQGWAPIYVMSTGTNRKMIYTSSVMMSEIPNLTGLSSTYELNGPHNGPGIFISRSTTEPASVRIGSTTLSKSQNIEFFDISRIGWFFEGAEMVERNEQSWFWDSESRILYAHYRHGSEITLTVNYGDVPPPDDGGVGNGDGGGGGDDGQDPLPPGGDDYNTGTPGTGLLSPVIQLFREVAAGIAAAVNGFISIISFNAISGWK